MSTDSQSLGKTNYDAKPCPFCGQPATIEQVVSQAVPDGVCRTVGCSTEDCYGYQSLATFDTAREAILAWNKRVNP